VAVMRHIGLLEALLHGEMGARRLGGLSVRQDGEDGAANRGNGMRMIWLPCWGSAAKMLCRGLTER
jgi:hypothetical protein